MDEEPSGGRTPVDPDEASALIPTWVATQGALNEAEAANIAVAVLWLENRAWEIEEVLAVDWLLQLHRRMFLDVWKWAGKTRQTGKNIGVPVGDIRPELTNLVADAKVWFLSDVTDPGRDLAAFHHRLVWIHAFPNGNGPHAREAANALARSAGLETPQWGGHNLAEPGEPRAMYLAALRAADRGDLKALIAFMHG